MHRKFSTVGYDDGLAEPGLHKNLNCHGETPTEHCECPGWGWREECWGDGYGPYLVPQWFTDDSIVYTLSTWVPYQVHLMRTKLADRDSPIQQPPESHPVNLAPAKLTNSDFGGRGTCTLEGWGSFQDSFEYFKGKDGICRMTTFTATKGNDALGALFQNFTVDAGTKALRFYIQGGEATVRLHRGIEIVRETRGRSGHKYFVADKSDDSDTVHMPDYWETEVCWNLGDYVGETLRVAIFDGKTGRWGFVGARGFKFLSSECPGPR